ncbi:MAG: hypothetical protein HYZ53_21775 [Planctomycetes bacterium]|nr:hypothetical protein [Planctomycetota bacterium]
MLLAKPDWRPDARKLREFGLTMLVGLGLLGALFRFGCWPVGGLRSWPLGAASPRAGLALWLVGLAVGLPALTGGKAGWPGYRAVMGLSYLLGSVIGPVLLAALYYGLFTPMGLVMRLVGRDALRLRREPSADTYWRDLPPPHEPARYLRQF